MRDIERQRQRCDKKLTAVKACQGQCDSKAETTRENHLEWEKTAMEMFIEEHDWQTEVNFAGWVQT